jgi:uncharacterized damage-inducible protein DinB
MSTSAQLAHRLRSEAEKVSTYFEMFNEEQWLTEVYTEDSIWTITNVLSHFVTAERGFLRLFEDVRQGGSGASEGFSIDRYNAEQQIKMKELTSEELLVEFRRVRDEMCRWVAGLSEVDLKKEGRHPFLGWVSLMEMIKMIYLHNQIHLRDIRKIFN